MSIKAAGNQENIRSVQFFFGCYDSKFSPQSTVLSLLVGIFAPGEIIGAFLQETLSENELEDKNAMPNVPSVFIVERIYLMKTA
jgi:hypothetical protein